MEPNKIHIGETAHISALVSNQGDLAGKYTASLQRDNQVIETRDIDLAGGASDLVDFNLTANTAGLLAVDINGLSGQLEVADRPRRLLLPVR